MLSISTHAEYIQHPLTLTIKNAGYHFPKLGKMVASLHLHSLDEALASSLALIPSLAHRIKAITCRQGNTLEVIAVTLLSQDMRLREDMISQVDRHIVVSLVEDVAHDESKRQGIMAQEGLLDGTREIPTPVLDLGIAKVTSTHQL